MAKKLPTITKKKSEKTTSKKVKFCGTAQFINAATGEVMDMQVTDIEERDFNFSKVWLKSFIQDLDLIGNQKMRVAFWIIENINRDNQLIATYKGISKQTGISLFTVNETMSVLQNSGFLKKMANGVYMINPDVLYKGTRPGRLNALHMYHDADNKIKKLSDTEKREKILSAIKRLQAELDKLDGKDIIEAEIDPQYSLNENMEIIQRAKPIKVDMKKHNQQHHQGKEQA